MPLKICSISDTHNRHKELNMPEADILLVAGDITENGSLKEVYSFDNWLGEIKDKYKAIYVVAGNHDFIFQEHYGLKLKNAKYLQDNFTYFPDFVSWKEGNGYLIYGSPWQPWFGSWAFNANRGEDIKQYWDKIPDEVDILITHGPPYGTLDEPHMVGKGRDPHQGCEELAKRILYLDNLKAHVFGHIHHGYGQLEKDGVLYVNSASAPHPKSKVKSPQVFEIN